MKSSQFNDSQRAKLLSLKEVDSAGCWIYTQSTARSGYGQIAFNGERGLLVHRVSYAMFNGDITDGLFVRHTCDVRACFNPEHLILGTNADNMQDVRDRGYDKVVTGSGEEHYNSKLTDADVIEMRRLVREEGMDAANAGKRFDMNPAAAHRIVVGKSWSHVPGALPEDYFTNEYKLKQRELTGKKRCPSCHENLPLSEFGKNKQSIDGLTHMCKPCRRVKYMKSKAERSK